MKEHILNITFSWESGARETSRLCIITPEHITTDNVVAALKASHHHLMNEDKADVYLDFGKSPETLVGYVCQKKGWSWKTPAIDASVLFDC